jgi:type I restriction enzyme S subunit
MSRNAAPTTLTLDQIGAFCSEWSESTLQEACQLVTDGTHDSPKEVNKGFPLVTGKCIKGGRLNVDAAYLISEVDHQKVISRSRAIKGDLLFANIGNSVGEVCLINEEVDISIKNLALFRPSKELDGVFLLAYLRSRRVQDYIRNTILGSAQPFIGLGTLRGFPVPLPPITEQRAIAHILGTLDDKIELNRKTNETLEAMAKALFKSWFVDFDPVRAKAEGRSTGLPDEINDLFPASFEDSELGEIPSGWECCSFTQLVEVISGGTPKTSIDEYWNGSINWFSVVDAPSGCDCWVIQTEKSITPQGLDNCSSKLLPTSTTIISARGTVGKVCLTGQDMAMNQSCYGLRSKAANSEYFCFYLTKSLVEILEARAHGSVFSTITRDTLDGVSTISPSLEVIKSFNGIAGSLLGKIKNNLEENRILGNQRDVLLPKLISGEIRIPDAEKMLEEVGV